MAKRFPQLIITSKRSSNMNKTIYIILLFTLVINSLIAQSAYQNYVEQTIYLNEYANDYVSQIQYYDGIGRPTQNVVGGCNTNSKYLHLHQEYDLSGRTIKSWSPVVGTNKNFISNINSVCKDAYSDPMAFEAIEYDALDRTISVSIPGTKWKENAKKKRIDYRSNYREEVRLFSTFDLMGSTYYQRGSLNCTEEYNEDSVLTTTFRDKLDRIVLVRHGNENNDTYYIYNEQGLLAYVLPPMYHLNSSEDIQTRLDKYAFQYMYDKRELVTSKKLPGCEPIYYWYNRARRLVCMQDGVLRDAGKYRFYLYDGLGRLCVQGLTTKCYEQKQFNKIGYTYQGPQISNSGYAYFGNASEIQLKEIELELVNYYDNDSFLDAYDAMTYRNPVYYLLRSKYKHSYLLGTKQRASNGEELLTTYAYDDYGRVCRKGEIGLNKQLTITEYSYNFVGDVTLETSEIFEYEEEYGTYNNIFESTITNNYDAPHTKLLTSSLITVRDDYSGYTMTDTIQDLTYDDFGHIIGNNRSGTAADMSYAYDNLHGWTKQIKSKGGFEQNLYRETEGKHPRWDGSISAMTWQTDEGSINRYDYEYDGLNRLTLADYTSKLIPVKQIVDFKDTPIDLIANQQYERTSIVTSAKLQALIPESEERLSDATLMTAQEEEPAISSSSRSSASTSGIIGQSKPGTATGIFKFSKINGNYTEAIAYDANTNITSLQRYGMKNDKSFGLIDDLSISHNGNQIISVSDAVDESLDYEGAFDFVDGDDKDQEYTYNGNGALTMDLNKGIQNIEYDLLGNPKKITLTNNQSIEYVYSADGRKLRTVYRYMLKTCSTPFQIFRTVQESTDYVGNLILKNGKPSMYQFSGGYYSFDGDKKPECHYYVQDYQGNNRMVVNAHTNEVEQTTHYYPYGGIIGNLSSNQEAQKYKYSNKELDRTYGLDLYDFQARLFNPALPVFDRPDPLAEDFTWLTPYNYCAGDPVNCVDPDGKAIIFVNGFRPGVGCRDQVRWSGGSNSYPSVYPTDEMKYWNTRIVEYYQDQYKDNHLSFTSGSASPVSTAAQREAEGSVKALIFHNQVADGKITLNGDEPIRLISHSQGGATAAGMASKLQELGYNVEIIEYITPHQATDINHPEGVKGVQYDQEHDRVVSGQGTINGISSDNYHIDSSHFWSLLGGHSNSDNLEIIREGERYRAQTR